VSADVPMTEATGRRIADATERLVELLGPALGDPRRLCVHGFSIARCRLCPTVAFPAGEPGPSLARQLIESFAGLRSSLDDAFELCGHGFARRVCARCMEPLR